MSFLETIKSARAFLTGHEAKVDGPEGALGLLSDACELAARSTMRYWDAEILRVEADVRLMSGLNADIETLHQEAIGIARQQGARSLELRAALSLARFWQSQGKRDEARNLLAAVYAWFTEGFDTRDLIEANALLGELA